MTFDPDAPAATDGLFGLKPPLEEARIAVIPVPWEATTSYKRGTRRGPRRLLEASWQVDLTDLDVGAAWKHGIAMLPPEERFEEWCDEAEPDALAVIAAGGQHPERAARVNELSKKANALVHNLVREQLEAGRIPAVIGGDHSIPYGAIQAATECEGEIGLLHIDAHADMRNAYEGFTWSHASILYNVMEHIPRIVKLVQVGIRDVGQGEIDYIAGQPDRITTWFDNRIARELATGATWLSLAERMIDDLPEKIWITFDIDGLDPAYCPATGTPVPGGLSFRDAVLLLEAAMTKRRVVGFDLLEIGDAEWDGNVAARLLYKMCGWAARP